MIPYIPIVSFFFSFFSFVFSLDLLTCALQRKWVLILPSHLGTTLSLGGTFQSPRLY